MQLTHFITYSLLSVSKHAWRNQAHPLSAVVKQ